MEWLALYTRKSLLIMLVLGFFSGLPLALTASTLTAWLADSGVERAAIGLFAAVATPYAFKFLWAPLMDGVRLPVLGALGRRRSWLLLSQVLLVGSIFAMAFMNPSLSPWLTALAALCVATASASQDIVIDAFRVERLLPEEQGAGAAMATFGYRLGMLVSGAGALLLADGAGWQYAYLVMAAMVACSLVFTMILRKPDIQNNTPASFSLSHFVRHSVMAPFADFMTRPHWAAVLAFVLLYKLGDAFLGAMFNPFLLDIGFTKSQIAEIVKLYGLVATLLGVFLGGLMVAKIGMFRALLIAGLAHMCTNLLLIVQAGLGPNEPFLILSIASENITGGMSTAAFIAYLSALCRVRYTATQYALLSSFAAMGRSWLSTPSGYVSQSWGWEIFFAISCIISLPSLALLWWLEARNPKLET
jgi:MFS transporter, PAT family, beta-lactamase induction signal transducer AmpG